MSKKAIYLQSQGIETGTITNVKPVRFVALNFDGIKITIDAYNDMFNNAEPREDCMVQVVDDKNVHELTAEQLLEAVKFYKAYHELGNDVVAYKNIFHNVLPDLYRKAVKQRKRGLEF